MRFSAIIHLLAVCLCIPSQVFASGALEQRQRALQQQQQQAIQQRQQQLIRQQQQAYQQALIQRQQIQQQVQQQVVQEVMEQRVAQQQAYNEAVKDKVQDVFQNRQQAIQSAQQQALEQMREQQAAYQQAMQQSGVLLSQQLQQLPSAQMNIPQLQAPAYGNMFYEPPVAEVVNITDVWEQMRENSYSWKLMIDMEPKVLTIQRMIDKFKENNIFIRKSPSHYVQLIDGMAFQNPELLGQPFENILKVVAIIEYDFDNGQDKDALARQIFPGPQEFQANRKRLGF